jgi:hypothetical protein
MHFQTEGLFIYPLCRIVENFVRVLLIMQFAVETHLSRGYKRWVKLSSADSQCLVENPKCSEVLNSAEPDDWSAVV